MKQKPARRPASSERIIRDIKRKTRKQYSAEEKIRIVLIDQINFELGDGKELLSAIVDSGASRLRPVAMAASTTALGMIPLLFDAFFISMAVTIIGGLMVASVLTMIVVPVFYAIFFKAPVEKDRNFYPGGRVESAPG
jgi:Cu/Ag efflux pump CusA